MFVQVIQGKAKDPAGLRKQWERWDQEIRPSATGYLGGTAGVTAKGDFIALARFEDEASARSNSDSATQSKWWEETSQYLSDPMFHDCTVVDLINEGGSDDAGFVQVIQGKVKDVDAARRLDKEAGPAMKDLRPDVIGGITAWHPENGRYTSAIYFTSEAEARKQEAKTETSEEFNRYMTEMRELADGESEFHDLSDPWMSGKP